MFSWIWLLVIPDNPSEAVIVVERMPAKSALGMKVKDMPLREMATLLIAETVMLRVSLSASEI